MPVRSPGGVDSSTDPHPPTFGATAAAIATKSTIALMVRAFGFLWIPM
jgi:hypothetical protein